MEELGHIQGLPALAGVAFAAAFCAGVLLACTVYGWFKNASRSYLLASSSGSSESRVQRLAQQGVKGVRGAARLLMKLKAVRAYCEVLSQALAQKSVASNPAALCSVLLVVGLFVMCAGSLVAASVVCGVALLGCLLLGVYAWAKQQNDTRDIQMRESLPDALQAMQACFSVGYSLEQTFSSVAQETSGLLSELFVEAAAVLETGGTADDALAVLKRYTHIEELVFIATALEIQHRSGSSMQQILQVTAESIQNELDLRRSLRVQTAQAKLSAQVVSVMPFLLVALFSLISEGFLEPFFESVAGILMLALALVMQAAGIILVRHMLNFEVAGK